MARKYGRRRVNAATCMANAAELKTSAVTNWLANWLLVSESSDLQETHERKTGEEGDVDLHWEVPSGRRRKGVVGPALTERYEREQAPCCPRDCAVAHRRTRDCHPGGSEPRFRGPQSG